MGKVMVTLQMLRGAGACESGYARAEAVMVEGKEFALCNAPESIMTTDLIWALRFAPKRVSVEFARKCAERATAYADARYAADAAARYAASAARYAHADAADADADARYADAAADDAASAARYAAAAAADAASDAAAAEERRHQHEDLLKLFAGDSVTGAEV